MIPITNITGRLGNQMFQMAFLYAYARNNDIDYYYQDPYFFEGHEEAVRTLFSGGIPQLTDAVAIHVRRGGNPLAPYEPKYSENPFYVDLCKTDYYQKAMALFPGQKFLVFSDDIEWCKKQKTFSKCEFANGTELEDLNKMASCKAHIIANSSFSWWGSYLSPLYPDNKTVAPSKEKWFSDGVERTICPIHWIRI